MIELLLDAVLLILEGLLFLIPDVDISTYVTMATDFADALGGYLGGYDSFLPISEVGVFLTWVATIYLPAAITFHLVLWVYGKVPVIGQS